MVTIKELFRIGTGPSSSHTIGPRKAAEAFLARNMGAKQFEVTLYGSLAATGKGHLTDFAILDVLGKAAPTTIVWREDIVPAFHPNGMKFRAMDANGSETDSWTVYSVGGGALREENEERHMAADIYTMDSMSEILKWCQQTGASFWEYVEMCEGKEIWDYLAEVWHTMTDAVERGINTEGLLPGNLNLPRKAVSYHIKASGYTASLHSRGLVFSYALAVAEENAAGGLIVTAPTCGSCGVIPGVLYHLCKSRGFSEQRMLRALATAGLFGNVAKHRASISGAEAGCQAEIGVACAMAAAAACQLFGGSQAQIEYAAEMGLEHHLGMTCDPIAGMVQIPCIERNACAAARAMDCNIYSTFSDGRHRISYDKVLEVMKQTGKDLPSLYRETSKGGLAKGYEQME